MRPHRGLYLSPHAVAAFEPVGRLPRRTGRAAASAAVGIKPSIPPEVSLRSKTVAIGACAPIHPRVDPAVSHCLSFVMPALGAGIHVLLPLATTWMAGTSPAMTTMSGVPLSSAPPMCDFAAAILLADKGTTMRTGLITAALTLIPAAAFAHTGAPDAHGFVWGFAHPFGGLDHILAMVTVGILAWQLGGRALVLVPATFVLVMAAGAALGMARIPLPPPAPTPRDSCWRPRCSTSPALRSAARSAPSPTAARLTGSAARSSRSRAWRSW